MGNNTEQHDIFVTVDIKDLPLFRRKTILAKKLNKNLTLPKGMTYIPSKNKFCLTPEAYNDSNGNSITLYEFLIPILKAFKKLKLIILSFSIITKMFQVFRRNFMGFNKGRPISFDTPLTSLAEKNLLSINVCLNTKYQKLGRMIFEGKNKKFAEVELKFHKMKKSLLVKIGYEKLPNAFREDNPISDYKSAFIFALDNNNKIDTEFFKHKTLAANSYISPLFPSDTSILITPFEYKTGDTFQTNNMPKPYNESLPEKSISTLNKPSNLSNQKSTDNYDKSELNLSKEKGFVPSSFKINPQTRAQDYTAAPTPFEIDLPEKAKEYTPTIKPPPIIPRPVKQPQLPVLPIINKCESLIKNMKQKHSNIITAEHNRILTDIKYDAAIGNTERATLKGENLILNINNIERNLFDSLSKNWIKAIPNSQIYDKSGKPLGVGISSKCSIFTHPLARNVVILTPGLKTEMQVFDGRNNITFSPNQGSHHMETGLIFAKDPYDNIISRLNKTVYLTIIVIFQSNVSIIPEDIIWEYARKIQDLNIPFPLVYWSAPVKVSNIEELCRLDHHDYEHPENYTSLPDYYNPNETYEKYEKIPKNDNRVDDTPILDLKDYVAEQNKKDEFNVKKPSLPNKNLGKSKDWTPSVSPLEFNLPKKSAEYSPISKSNKSNSSSNIPRPISKPLVKLPKIVECENLIKNMNQKYSKIVTEDHNIMLTDAKYDAANGDADSATIKAENLIASINQNEYNLFNEFKQFWKKIIPNKPILSNSGKALWVGISSKCSIFTHPNARDVVILTPELKNEIEVWDSRNKITFSPKQGSYDPEIGLLFAKDPYDNIVNRFNKIIHLTIVVIFKSDVSIIPEDIIWEYARKTQGLNLRLPLVYWGGPAKVNNIEDLCKLDHCELEDIGNYTNLPDYYNPSEYYEDYIIPDSENLLSHKLNKHDEDEDDNDNSDTSSSDDDENNSEYQKNGWED